VRIVKIDLWSRCRKKDSEPKVASLCYNSKYVLFLDYATCTWSKVTKSAWKSIMLQTIIDDFLGARLQDWLAYRIFRCLLRIPAKESKLFEDCFDIWVKHLDYERAYSRIAEYLVEHGYEI